MKNEEKNKRMFLLLLPLLILPFLALGFYALGGGKGVTGDHQQVSNGINTSLPGAQLKDGKSPDKMALYDKAGRDSASARSGNSNNAFAALGWDTAKAGLSKAAPANNAQVNEVKINQRLAEINRQISHPTTTPQFADSYSGSGNPDLDRMEKLLKQKQHGNTEDPEMKQLSTMLDKIMQIQNPSLASDKKQINLPNVKDTAFKAIPAYIDGNQKVAPGGVVNLRLKDTIRLNGLLIPKGQALSGLCSVTNQRLLLEIINIRLGTAIIPVSLTVFSLDGLVGINAPEAELSEAAGGGANSALENMQFLSMDQSLTTQAATAGITAAKGLLGKKVKKIRIKLKNYTVLLLRNNKK
ncbi:conjugative transposon protein TraM [Mucilaginibacter sp.]|uniref:conjugative transposon protein TraM n=1 Tax=Mucilaginibacter sp. TaxID=1882438 RepID=UPI003264BB97